MTDIQQWGIEFILALQTHQSPFLDNFFYIITQFGGFGYIFIAPLIIWCIEPRLGLRVLLAMLVSQYIVMLIKDIVQEPRPFIVDSRIVSDGEHGLSFPSGHAMGSLVFYGMLILATNKKWLQWSLVPLIFFIGLSRNYLGVHYPHDVVAGWLLGLVFLWGWLRLEAFTHKNLYMMHISRQRFFSVAIPSVVGIAHYYVFDYNGTLVLSGSISLLLLAMIEDNAKPILLVTGSLPQKVARYGLGAALVFGAFVAILQIYPDEQHLLYNVVIWLNGAAVTAILAYIAPKLFSKIKLASNA